MDKVRESKRSQWVRKLRSKYRLVIMDDQTFEERLSFRLSRLNVFLLTGSLSILLVILTIYLIAFTPLREYIPGYMDIGMQEDLYVLERRADSLEHAFYQKDLYISNLRRIMEGKEVLDRIPEPDDSLRDYGNITLTRSEEDSLLRNEIEQQRDQYSLRFMDEVEGLRGPTGGSLGTLLFFTPVKGIVINPFDPSRQHYGVDVVSQRNEPVKAAMDGHVVFSGWTLETGYVIALAHNGSILTIYKHNATLLKEQGNYVHAGDPIAIIGNSGELTTGPHLHFELWHMGMPVDPTDYIAF